MVDKIDPVKLASIVLNPKNYRHDEVPTSDECFAALMVDEKSRRELLELAGDIAANGLDPSSLPIVVPVGRHFRVMEGNRRIAVLKAMTNPDVIPDLDGLTDAQVAKYRDKFEVLGGIAEVPTEILCYINDDADKVDHWVTLKHTGVGQHKGAGTVEWDTTGRARHEMALAGGSGRASSDQSGRAVLLLDALRTEFAGDTEMIELIDAARKSGITTLGRLLIKPENRLSMGVQIDGNEVKFVVENSALRASMFRVLSDLGTPVLNSRSVNTAGQVTDYLKRVEKDLPKAEDRANAPRPPGTGSGRTTAKPTKKAVAKRAKVAAIERTPFKGLKLRHASEKTKELLKEMQRYSFETEPYTIAVLNRTLIDLFTWDVMNAMYPDKKVTESPSARMFKVMQLIEPANTRPRDRKFPLIMNAMEKDIGDLAIDTMNGYMHRATWHPNADIVRRQAEQYGPFLKELDDIVEAKLLADQESKKQ